MSKAEYYAKMRELFKKHFGEDFREHRLEIKKRLRAGEAPEINKLYQEYTYAPGFARMRHTSRPWFHMYNIWDYERFNNLWKYL